MSAIEDIRASLIALPKTGVEKLIRLIGDLKNRRDAVRILHLVCSDICNTIYGYGDAAPWLLTCQNDQVIRLLGNNGVLFSMMFDQSMLASNTSYFLSLESNTQLPSYSCAALSVRGGGTHLLPVLAGRLHDKVLDVFVPEFFTLMFVRYLTASRNPAYRSLVEEAGGRDLQLYMQLLSQYLDNFFPIRSLPWLTLQPPTPQLAPRIHLLLFMSEFWLNQASDDATLQSYQVPSPSVCSALQLVLCHFQIATSTFITEAQATKDDDTIWLLRPLFVFFHGAFTRWPAASALGNLHVVIDLWLSLLQPWQASGTMAALQAQFSALKPRFYPVSGPRSTTPVAEVVVKKWTFYIQKWFPFYSILLSEFVQLALKFDHARPEYTELVNKVLSVFNNPALLALLRHAENDLIAPSPAVTSASFSPAAYLRSRIQLICAGTTATQHFAPLSLPDATALDFTITPLPSAGYHHNNLHVSSTTAALNTMAGFEYSPYPGIAPVVSYAVGGQRRLRDLAPHESAARLHTLLHLAHQSLKFWDRNRAVLSSTDSSAQFRRPLVQHSRLSLWVRTYLPYNNRLVKKILQQLQGSVPESAVVRARRVRQQWRRAVERVLAANRFGAVQRDSDAQRELLGNLAAVFNLSDIEIRQRQDRMTSQQSGEAEGSDRGGFGFDDRDAAMRVDPNTHRMHLSMAAKRQLVSGQHSSSRFAIPYIGDVWSRPQQSHEFVLLLCGLRWMNECILSRWPDVDCNLRLWASWHTWLQLALLLCVAKIVLVIVF